MSTNCVPQCYNHMVLEPPWQWLHHLPGQSVPLHHCSFSVLPHIQPGLLWCNLRPLPLVLSTTAHIPYNTPLAPKLLWTKLSSNHNGSSFLNLQTLFPNTAVISGGKLGFWYTSEIILIFSQPRLQGYIWMNFSGNPSATVLWNSWTVVRSPQKPPLPLSVILVTQLWYRVPWTGASITGNRFLDKEKGTHILLKEHCLLWKRAVDTSKLSLYFMWLWHTQEVFMALYIIIIRLSTFKDFKGFRWNAMSSHLGPNFNEGLDFWRYT